MNGAIKCTVRGMEFPSIRAACRYFNVPYANAKYHFDRWGHLDRLGTGQKRDHYPDNRKPFVAFGRKWESRAALARYAGVSPSTVSRWLQNGPSVQMMAALMKADAKAARDQQEDAA